MVTIVTCRQGTEGGWGESKSAIGFKTSQLFVDNLQKLLEFS